MKKLCAILLTLLLMLPLLPALPAKAETNGMGEMNMIYTYFDLVRGYPDGAGLLEYSYFDLDGDGWDELFLQYGDPSNPTYDVYSFQNGYVFFWGSFDACPPEEGHLVKRGGEGKLYLPQTRDGTMLLFEIRLTEAGVKKVQVGPALRPDADIPDPFFGCSIESYAPDEPFCLPALSAIQKAYVQKMQEVMDGTHEFDSVYLADLTGDGMPVLIYSYPVYPNLRYECWSYKQGGFVRLGSFDAFYLDFAYPDDGAPGIAAKQENGGITRITVENNQIVRRQVSGNWDDLYSLNETVIEFSFSRLAMYFRPEYDYAKRFTPAAPKNVRVKQTGDTTALVEWDAVPNTSLYNVYRYDPAQAEDEELLWIGAAAGADTALEVADLHSQTRYTFFVSAETDVEGMHLFSDFSAGVQFAMRTASPDGLAPGDVNGDGDVGADDARLALRRSVDLETYPEGSVQFNSCDVDWDGAVTAMDARLILRGSVGLEDKEAWRRAG